MTGRRTKTDTYIEDRVTRVLLAEHLASVLDTLSEREAHIVVAQIGLRIPADLVAQRFGITTDRVQKVRMRALAKLRHESRSTVLRDYVDGPDATGSLCASLPLAREVAEEYGLDRGVTEIRAKGATG